MDRLVNPGDAYHTYMRGAHDAVESAREPAHLTAGLRPVAAGSVARVPGEPPVVGTACSPHRVRASLLVVRAGKSCASPYRLWVATANRDDTTPGIFIGNNLKVQGVNGGIDFRGSVPLRCGAPQHPDVVVTGGLSLVPGP